MDFYIDVADTEACLLGEKDFLNTVVSYLQTLHTPYMFKIFASSRQIKNLNVKLSSTIQVLTVKEIIYSNDTPLKKRTKSKDNALAQGIAQLKNSSAYFLSSSNTGMLVQYIRSIFGLQHVAIAGIFPNRNGSVIVSDLGAHLTLGEQGVLSMLEEVYSLIFYLNPQRIKGPLQFSLVNIGEEHYKGPLSIRRLDRLFSKKKNKNYIYNGFSEGFDIFLSSRDELFILDGFVGNTVLKAIEGFQMLLKETLLAQKKKIDIKSTHLLDFSSLSVGILLAKGLTGRLFLTHGRVSAKEFIKGIDNSLAIIKNMQGKNIGDYKV